MNRMFVLVGTPLLAAPIVTAFLLVGGTVEQPGRPAVEMPVPVTGDAGCRPKTTCPYGFARPLEC